MGRLIGLFAILHVFAKISTPVMASFYADDFLRLTNKPYFIDKTEFIKDIFSSESKKILLTSPRGFGKTINLQMIQFFVEIEPDEYGVPKHPLNSTANYVFENMAIAKHPEIVKKYMAKHPVIFLDLKADPVLHSFSEGELFPIREQMIRQVNTKLYNCFAKHNWLLQIPEEVLIHEYKIDEKKINFMRRLYEKNLENSEEKRDDVLHKMLLNLAEILHLYYRSSVIILVDNYDSMMNNAYKPHSDNLRAYYDYVNNILQRAFENSDENLVAGGVLMSTTGLILSNVRTFLSQTEFHPFMGENSKFTKYFGFTEQEVVHLLDIYECQSHLNDIKSYYNGYKTVYQDLSIYNPTSVLLYLHNRDNDPLRVYWNNSLVDNFLVSFLKDTLLNQTANKIITNGTTGYHMAECYTATNYLLLLEVIYNHKYEKTDQGLILWLLYDHGYLSHRVVETDTPGQFLDAMGAPNYDTRQALQILLNCTDGFERESSHEWLNA
ncbi:hypothetical protein U1Q18_051198 [Sarracenia purpurea var. burkii]